MREDRKREVTEDKDDPPPARKDDFRELGDVEGEGQAGDQVHGDDSGQKELDLGGKHTNTTDIMRTTDLVTSQPTVIEDPVNGGYKAIDNKACEEDQPAIWLMNAL